MFHRAREEIQAALVSLQYMLDYVIWTFSLPGSSLPGSRSGYEERYQSILPWASTSLPSPCPGQPVQPCSFRALVIKVWSCPCCRVPMRPWRGHFFAEVRIFCLQNVEDDLVTTSGVKSQNKSAGVFLWQCGWSPVSHWERPRSWLSSLCLYLCVHSPHPARRCGGTSAIKHSEVLFPYWESRRAVGGGGPAGSWFLLAPGLRLRPLGSYGCRLL